MISGCGILPYYINDDGETFFLLGRYKEKLEDLGGRIEKDESSIECAVREFYEESGGMLWSIKDLTKMVRRNGRALILNTSYIDKDTHKKITKSYISYALPIDYTDELESKINKYNIAKKFLMAHGRPLKVKDKDWRGGPFNINTVLNRRTCNYPEGFFEMDSLEWVNSVKLQIRKGLCYRLFRVMKLFYK